MADGSSARDSTVTRRLLSVGGVLAAGVFVAPLVVLALPLLAVWDLATGRLRFPRVRCALFALWYLLWEWVAVFAGLGLWVASGFGATMWGPTMQRAHTRLQVVWAESLWAALERVLGLRLHVVGEDHLGPGPVVCFTRHASLVDTLIPIRLFERHGMRCRYIMKDELLWDPALDIVGHRLPNYFVDRSGRNTPAELAAIRDLAAGTHTDEAVILFPEGSRFTVEKRARAVEKLRESDPELGALAEKLSQTMPPRAGGSLATLEGAPEGADVVIVAHTGLEGLAGLKDLIREVPFRRPVEVECWRIPGSEIPANGEERLAWLFRQWADVDQWVVDHRRGTD